MRIRNVSMLAAAVAAMGLSVAASAITVTPQMIVGNYNGGVVMHLSDVDVGTTYTLSHAILPAGSVLIPNTYTSLADGANPVNYGYLAGGTIYTVIPATLTVTPNPSSLLSGVTVEDDTFAIVRVDQIFNSSQTTQLFDGLTGTFQIYGVASGLQDKQLTIDGNGVQHIEGVGMNFSFYAVPTGAFAFNPATLLYTGRTGNDQYTGLTTLGSAELIWTAASIQGQVPSSSNQVFITLDPNSITNQITGDTIAKVGGAGALNSMFTSDLEIHYTAQPNSSVVVDKFPYVSVDPVRSTVQSIPTPAAAWGGVVFAGDRKSVV